MAWVEYNPNPLGKRTGDCTVRAFAKAMDLDWDEAYLWIALEGYLQKAMPSENGTWGMALKQGGYSQRSYASYEDGMSMRRGRDSMGRFRSYEDGGASMRGGSYHDGGGQETRQAIEEIKRKLDQMM